MMTYLVFFLLLLIVLISVFIIFVVIVFIFEVVLVEITKVLLELQCLTSEPIDGAGDEFLFDIFTKLVVQLKFLLELIINLFVIVDGWSGRVEEVEERRSWDALLHDAGLFGV